VRTISKRAFGMAALVFAAACNENGGDSLNLAEKQALTQALSTSDAFLAVPEGSYAPFAVYMLPNIGTLSAGSQSALNSALSASLSGLRAASYDGAIGVQVIVTAQGQSYTFTGVLGWADLNVANNTVDEVVLSGGLTNNTTPIGTGSFTINGTTTVGAYWIRSPEATYGAGTSGTFELTAASFTGTQVECASITETSVCNYRTGTMSGSFNFTADRYGATGTPYTQSTVTFTNLPSVRVTIVE
jgi:hypothetical protein